MPHEAHPRERTDMVLLRRYRSTGDPIAREQLTERMLPLVRSLARKYQGRGEDADDVMQAGLLGLTKAIERFDLDAGNRFVSYAAPNVTGEIRRHFRDHTWSVHVPRSMQELDAKVQATSRELEKATGRTPTDEDVSRELSLPLGDVREARVAGRSYRALSLDAPAGDARDAAETHGHRDPGFDHVVDRDLLDRATAVLTARDRRIVERRFLDERLQREIADEFAISQMQISRIIAAAVAKMQAHLDPALVAA